ncbi:MAG: bifunctional riboflavin kinase/FAD synthetase [Pirellulaceae bacterium]|nr:bifunctional riboflavin kinase/FAD synthetase [Pirellulaceae bacterium]
MRLLRTLDTLPIELRGGAVAIGNFDGVHQGHARIVQRLLERARRLNGPAIVFTFDPHPVQVLRPGSAPPPLTWTERKAELLFELGVDAVLAYPTDDALLRLAPGEFFQRIVCQRLRARALVEGPNFRFGHERAGDLQTLRQLCRQSGVELDVVEPIEIGGQYVSSSRIRDLVRGGQVLDAARQLTRPYRVRGLVTHGARRGRQIGFPTANLDGIDTLIPAPGVYAGRALAAQGTWEAAINIGPNPTFGEHGPKFEVHLLDFIGSLYGEVVEVDILARLRDIQPFDSVQQLQEQLRRDVEDTRQRIRDWKF